jgi:DNA-binding beta-propeller fold protein YncE
MKLTFSPCCGGNRSVFVLSSRPFAYRKSPSQIFELKGRTVSNKQDFRHVCTTRGAQSVCHRCEEFICGTGIDARPCNMQLQGILWAQLPSNIPTVTDTPFALGPNITHRNDFGNADKVCLFVQGGACLQHNTTDFSSCAVRCWGKTYDPPEPYEFGWTYPKDEGLPQGKVFTLAGSGGQGFADGVGVAAKFDRPEAVAVDMARNVYVADTGNHCIRRIAPDGTVTTFAGLCTVPGFRDGPPDAARFRSPSGITLYHNASDHNRLTIYVSDTGNHRIRRIRREPGWDGNWEVVTWAGGRSVQIDSKISPAGLQNGMRTEAAFNYPRGLAVDDTNALYVADTFNHLIRYIDPVGNVSILAGVYVSMWNASRGREGADPGCIFPCWEGVPGFDDGPRQFARFNFPQDVSIGENHTVRAVVIVLWSCVVTCSDTVVVPMVCPDLRGWGQQATTHHPCPGQQLCV